MALTKSTASSGKSGGRTDRMERVLDFWRAGDIVPRNPFLHSSLWGKSTKKDASRGEDDSLAGYSESGENGRILNDIRDVSPEPDGINRVRCRYGGGWRQSTNDWEMVYNVE